MKMVLVSVFDSVAKIYGRPFVVQSEGSAVRAFSDEVNRKDGTDDLHKHPADFSLLSVGTFDDSTGEIVGTSPVVLVKGSFVAIRGTDNAN